MSAATKRAFCAISKWQPGFADRSFASEGLCETNVGFPPKADIQCFGTKADSF
jgi:hypothetical protein